jgi:hypothetical protein
LDSLPLKMGPIGCPETSVRNCHYSLQNNPEERSSHPLRGGSLQSCMIWLFKYSISRDKFIVTSNDLWVKWTKEPTNGVWLFYIGACTVFNNTRRLWGRWLQLPDGFISHSLLFRVRGCNDLSLHIFWAGCGAAFPRIFFAVWWTRLYFSSRITLVVLVT